ncbi:prefoldin beta-like domain containing protein [Cavenderia fasciculata]|uniref:Prefoldin beta-like domain containing protein n=1 Tax=Cavenderia fasciculata TaxID=261658 RepID=F4PKZ9_CACFS|nr:prefoldin beta-like domain containing protein [Cavenderia fasciculata]EGG23221.1 prefoldin beta-like domain containing protein [Cavenderia fasciculata]|eukprot:XP_004361072.1 prefoldin beta-like domain containing protein [Cavenderia fasciculata]
MSNPQAQLQVLQEQLIKARDEFQKQEKEIQKIQQARATLLTQQNENEMVKKEFDLLEKDANIFKLIGPVLFKQSKEEAETTINARLDLISKNLKQVESNYKDVEKKALDQRTKIFETQGKMRSIMQPQQPQQPQQQ